MGYHLDFTESRTGSVDTSGSSSSSTPGEYFGQLPHLNSPRLHYLLFFLATFLIDNLSQLREGFEPLT